MKKFLTIAAVASMAAFTSCDSDDGKSTTDNVTTPKPEVKEVTFKDHSSTPAYFKMGDNFKDVKVHALLSSTDQLEQSPEFVYGSMADGAGLLKNDDGTFTLINNIEADFSVARITLDETFKPVKGEYILSAIATGFTAQCSGSMITPREHGFGPLYMSGGEWQGNSKGVFLTNPRRDAASADVPFLLEDSMGAWSTENAVAIGKNAFPGKTVVFIGDDNSNNSIPSGQLGMYVGNSGDLLGGKLYTLKVNNKNIAFEMDMEEGKTFDAEFIEMEERELERLDTEAKEKGAMGFSRLEDIDWRRGSASNNREIYFCVTGRKKDGLVGRGTLYGRIYRVVLDANDPTKAKITCILDGDKEGGKAWGFHSPDNILVTENYAYIQEDPNGYKDAPVRDHYARLYQYNLNTGELKMVLECDQVAATKAGVGNETKNWEITGMIDITEETGKEAFLMITQNHGWEKADGTAFTDPKANPLGNSRKEGSQLFVVEGLAR